MWLVDAVWLVTAFICWFDGYEYIGTAEGAYRVRLYTISTSTGEHDIPMTGIQVHHVKVYTILRGLH
jgi:hypothetical protein